MAPAREQNRDEAPPIKELPLPPPERTNHCASRLHSGRGLDSTTFASWLAFTAEAPFLPHPPTKSKSRSMALDALPQESFRETVNDLRPERLTPVHKKSGLCLQSVPPSARTPPRHRKPPLRN